MNNSKNATLKIDTLSSINITEPSEPKSKKAENKKNKIFYHKKSNYLNLENSYKIHSPKKEIKFNKLAFDDNLNHVNNNIIKLPFPSISNLNNRNKINHLSIKKSNKNFLTTINKNISLYNSTNELIKSKIPKENNSLSFDKLKKDFNYTKNDKDIGNSLIPKLKIDNLKCKNQLKF